MTNTNQELNNRLQAYLDAKYPIHKSNDGKLSDLIRDFKKFKVSV